MGVLDALWHLGGFIAPALFLALLLPLLEAIFKRKVPLAAEYIKKFALLFIACSASLVIGLVLTGRDGKMFSYLGMLLCAALVQCVLMKRNSP